MTHLEHLPPDQSAALSLLLRRRRGYDEVASLLGVSPTVLHDRAHAALAVLAPPLAARLTAGQREQIGEYLLGQSPEGAQAATSLLASSPDATAWARALRAELAPIAADLPEIPPEPAAPGPPAPPVHTPRLRPSLTGSRRGGVAVLAAIAVVVVVVVVLVVGGKGSSSPGVASGNHSSHSHAGHARAHRGAGSTDSAGVKRPGGSAEGTGANGKSRSGAAGGSSVEGNPGESHAEGNPGESQAEGGSGESSTEGTAGKPKLESTLSLTSPEGAATKGTLGVFSSDGKQAFLLIAEGLEPNSGEAEDEQFTYLFWLTGPEGKTQAWEAPEVKENGEMEAVHLLPAKARSFDHMELTRQEGKGRPESTTTPGKAVLEGAFSLH